MPPPKTSWSPCDKMVSGKKIKLRSFYVFVLIGVFQTGFNTDPLEYIFLISVYQDNCLHYSYSLLSGFLKT